MDNEQLEKRRFRPGVPVHVSNPVDEHEKYKNSKGVINDIREFGASVWCQVRLEPEDELVYFYWNELGIEEQEHGRHIF